jgi:predicted unusual protein kinase regulating ubiquinone biosynthesis (AarF/ABC1/UbiB family)
MLLELSGLYVKSAQILASKGDFMPKAWVRPDKCLPIYS